MCEHPRRAPLTALTTVRAGLVLIAAAALPLAAEAAAERHAPPARATGCPVPDAAAADEAWPGQAAWRRLEQADYRLGEVRVRVADVYVGASLAWYQRLANTVHQDTEPEVIAELLTVSPGDTVAAERIYEAERVLRGQPFLTHARIVPVACVGDRVISEVRVRDAWTLEAGAGIGSAGGEATSSAGVREKNFFGSGKTVSLNWREGRERTTLDFGYRDPALLGSAWTLGLNHGAHSDGERNAVSLARPFRQADQPWGFDSAYEAGRRELDFEQAAETAYSTEVESRQVRMELLRRIAGGERGGWRAGAGWRRDDAEFTALEEDDPSLRPPPVLNDRHLSGPYLVLERFSERHESFRNLQAIGTTEDYELGFDARLVTGRYAEGDRWFYELGAQHGVALGERDLFTGRVDLSARYADEGGKEAVYRSLTAEHYHRITQRNTWVTHGEYAWRDDPDPEDELYLGGYDGLLAYPNRFRSGDRRWLLHLEHRYVSELILFDTVQMGSTVFFEAGNVRGFDGRWGRTLQDIGAGLRVGSLRSAYDTVAYVAVAAPLIDAGQSDDYSIVLGSTINF